MAALDKLAEGAPGFLLEPDGMKIGRLLVDEWPFGRPCLTVRDGRKLPRRRGGPVCMPAEGWGLKPVGGMVRNPCRHGGIHSILTDH